MAPSCNEKVPPSRSAESSIVEDGLFPAGPSETVATASKETTIRSRADQEQDTLMKASWQLKVLVLLCMLALPVGCHYLEATMGTLKTTLKTSMHINNTQFSILLSAVTLVNTVLPFFAGTFIDDISVIGSIRGTTIISVVIFIGSLLVSLGGEHNSYPVMITGQIIYGLGGGMIVTMQEGILSRWFRDRQLSIVIGILLCVARLTKWAAKMVCYPIINSTGSHAMPIHVATIFCGAGVMMNIVYWVIMWRFGWATPSGKEMIQIQHNYRNHFYHTEHSKFRYTYSLLLYLPGTFWMIPWIQLVMSSVLSSFDDIATEFIQFRFQTSSVMAGYQSSLTQVVPIVVAPIMGIVLHRYGKRVTNLFFATLVLITSMILLAYTRVLPAVGMIIFSLALALGPVSVLSSTSLLLPYELAGTGMGLHKCANNIGTTIVAVLVGYVQDLTYHDGNPHDDVQDLEREYDGVLVFYLSMACASALVVAIFWLMDRKLLDSWLEVDRNERNRRLDAVKAEQEQQEQAMRYPFPQVDEAEQDRKRKLALRKIGSHMRQKKTYVYLGFYLFWLVVAWAIFFTFALMPVYQNYD